MTSMWRFLSIPPSTDEQDWWPTPRWALRGLGMYAIAALSGGLVFMLSAAFLAFFQGAQINQTIPSESRPLIAPSHKVIERPPLVANAQDSAKLIYIANLLENKDKDPKAIRTFTDEEKLQQKYPLGFALFYSNGRKTLLYYTRTSSAGISFDPSQLEVSRNGDNYCMNILPIRINGKLLDNIKHICVHDTFNITEFANAYLDLEPLASTTDGAAWVLGMRPKN